MIHIPVAQLLLHTACTGEQDLPTMTLTTRNPMGASTGTLGSLILKSTIVGQSLKNSTWHSSVFNILDCNTCYGTSQPFSPLAAFKMARRGYKLEDTVLDYSLGDPTPNCIVVFCSWICVLKAVGPRRSHWDYRSLLLLSLGFLTGGNEERGSPETLPMSPRFLVAGKGCLVNPPPLSLSCNLASHN